MLSCERLFSLKKPVYFWTFTFVDVYHEWEYGPLWNRFIQALDRAFGNRSGSGFVRGIRVIEPHVSHGLHYHALINRRLSIHIVNRVAARFGMGRISVVRCDKKAGQYLCKYLGKSVEFATRIRSWGAIGGFRCCKCKDVEVASPFTENRIALYGHGGRASITAMGRLLAYSVLHGRLPDWPQDLRSRETAAAFTARRTTSLGGPDPRKARELRSVTEEKAQ